MGGSAQHGYSTHSPGQEWTLEQNCLVLLFFLKNQVDTGNIVSSAFLLELTWVWTDKLQVFTLDLNPT